MSEEQSFAEAAFILVFKGESNGDRSFSDL
jgi:hypothetical protein